MYSLLILTALGLLFTLVLTPLARDCAIRFGLVDKPDRVRKLHHQATPRIGGVPVFLSYGGSFLVLMLLPTQAGQQIHSNSAMILRLFPAVAVVFATGLLDDLLNLKPWQKLCGQIAGAILAFTVGVRIPSIGGYVLPEWSSLAITIGWLILCANAFNLIDGVDGLAAGVGLTATLTILTAGLLHGDINLALATAPLAGCLLGFLYYNFNPASIFLGDSGALLIGFLLGAYGIIWGQKNVALLGMAAPAMALGLPLVEVGVSILRRFLRNEPIFSADRGHIHHRLLDRGFTPRRAALLLYAVCGVGAALSLLQGVLHNLSGAVVLLFAACACGGIQYLGYVEFNATRRFLWGGLRPMLGAHVKLEAFERALSRAATLDQCWQSLEAGARSLGYSQIDASLAGQRYGRARPRTAGGAFWQMRLNLPDRDFVNITQMEDSAEQPVLVIAFAEIVRRVLPVRLEQVATASESLANLAAALETSCAPQAAPRNSSTRTVISSDCSAPSVNPATAS
jgi:UDP-GlcNAc:undecaprenyl-phosphate/decaprenyl-phosphate GlcNAc-1-phosphate transferase